MSMNEIEFGRELRRREDDRLIAGTGRYTSDLRQAGALHAAFVRSPYAAARVGAVDIAQAAAMPGVRVVLTGADLMADGITAFSLAVKMEGPDGVVRTETPRDLLVLGEVRHLGEPVAMVIAESSQAAQDAAEAVMVDYEDLAPVVSLADASAVDARRVWADRAGNVAFRWRRGDVEAVTAAMQAAPHVVRQRLPISRVSALPMEPRAALAYPDEIGRTVLNASHQNPHQLRTATCRALGMDASALRVLVTDVGGSFGMKSGLLREEALCVWASRRLGAAVRWTATRSESFLSDEQGRSLDAFGELAFDDEGVFRALKVRYDINIGAYLSQRSVSAVTNFGGIAGVYRTPAIVGEAVGYFSNTPPIAAYRGAGRPEAIYVTERLIDLAAAELGMDRVEIRRRNLIAPDQMPYQTPFVFRYDCGEFERNMDRALEAADHAGFEARRAEAALRGRLRGIGIANPIEVAGGPYGNTATDHARVEAHADGSVTVTVGTMSVGQGHETMLSDLVAQALGMPLEQVRYVQGDTDAIAQGKGNGGSAALTLCGPAIQNGVADLLEKGATLAAEALEASPLDIEFGAGLFRIVGSDRAISLAEVVALAKDGLMGAGAFKLQQPTFPNGCHVCEVEIDPETGSVFPVSYTSVEDVGRVLNPVLVDGQIHGGVAQGMGQALGEEIVFGEDGQIMSGSFMDYMMPRADDLPSITSLHRGTPTELNSLGVKGVGEAGTVGALAATMSAICHALSPLGIAHFDMPATPQRIWRAIADAKGDRN